AWDDDLEPGHVREPKILLAQHIVERRQALCQLLVAGASAEDPRGQPPSDPPVRCDTPARSRETVEPARAHIRINAIVEGLPQCAPQAIGPSPPLRVGIIAVMISRGDLYADLKGLPLSDAEPAKIIAWVARAPHDRIVHVTHMGGAVRTRATRGGTTGEQI